MIFVYLISGWCAVKFNLLKPIFSARLNFVVINICLPALTLLSLPKLEFSRDLWMPVSMAWMVFLLAIPFFLLGKKLLGFNNSTLGSLILCCGLLNSAFVGFPVMKALYGEEGLSIAIVTDQAGSFLVLSTLGIFAAAFFSSGKADIFAIAKKIFSFPPLWAFVIAVVMWNFKVQIPAPYSVLLSYIAMLLVPLALFSVGLQLNIKPDLELKKEIAAGLLYKLVIAPIFVFCVFRFFEKDISLIMKVSSLQAAMGPMVSGSILAITYNLNPKLSNTLVGIGIPISFATIAFWYFILEFVL